MKQKTLLTVKAFVCFALTIILAVTCLFPLTALSLDLDETTWKAASSVIASAKMAAPLNNPDVTESELEKLTADFEAVETKLADRIYPDWVKPDEEKAAYDAQETIIAGLRLTTQEYLSFVEKYDEYETVCKTSRNNLSTEQKNELDEKEAELKQEVLELAKTIVQQSLANSDYDYAKYQQLYTEKCEKYDNREELKLSDKEIEQLEKEIEELNEKIANPPIVSGISKDVFGYKWSFSVLDLVRLPSFIKACKLMFMQYFLHKSTPDYVYSNPSGESAKEYLEQQEEYLKYVADYKNYEGVSASDIDKAIGFVAIINTFDFNYPSLDAVTDIIINGDVWATPETMFALVWLVTAVILTIVIFIIAVIRCIVALTQIGKKDKFFAKTTVSFISLASCLFVVLCLSAIGGGAALTTYGTITLVLIILGSVGCGIASRCSKLSKKDAWYVTLTQISGAIYVACMVALALSGSNFFAGLTSNLSYLSRDLLFLNSDIADVLFSFLLICVPIPAAMLARISLQKVACMYDTKNKLCKYNDGSGRYYNNYLVNTVCQIIVSVAFVVLAVLGFALPIVWYVITCVLLLGSTIAFKVFTKKESLTFTDEELKRLDLFGMQYENLDQPVAVPFSVEKTA